MARIRSIKPEFWTDSAVVTLTPFARLLLIGIWNHADDFGVVKDDPFQLAIQVLPRDDVDPDALVDELVAGRLLVRMKAEDGTPVLVVRTWERHQKVDKRSPGRYGHPSTFTEGVTGSRPIPPNPSEPRRIPPAPSPGREGNGVEKKPCPPSQERREDVDRLCDLMAELIVDNGCRRPNVTTAWRDEARRLLDRDGVPLSEAERVMRWALADSFWKSNVLSLPTFRKQYDRLKVKANGTQPPPARVGINGRPTI